jgi:hypothetical protein
MKVPRQRAKAILAGRINRELLSPSLQSPISLHHPAVRQTRTPEHRPTRAVNCRFMAPEKQVRQWSVRDLRRAAILQG